MSNIEGESLFFKNEFFYLGFLKSVYFGFGK